MQQPLPPMEVKLDTVMALMVANKKRWPIDEAMAKLNEVAKAVKTTGKKGSVTMKITVSTDKDDELCLAMEMDVTSTTPKLDRKKELLYPAENFDGFSKTDPRQLELLAEQEAEKAEREEKLREAGIAKIGRGTESIPA